jgi:hypothetical protein
METLLIAITVVSLGVALAMGVVAWRTSQELKRQGAARVAALTAAAGLPERAAPHAPGTDVVGQVPVGPTPIRDERGAEPGLSTFPRASSSVHAPGTVSVHSGFLGAEAPVRESGNHQRWLATAAAILAVVLGGFVYVRMSGNTQAAATQAEAASPLELLSLRHEREGVNLSVAGLVRNPPSGAVVERVTALVYLFDQQGSFVTSAKAPIDFLKLTAGDESPFVIKVAAPQSVARYRVSFRTDDGTLQHVDRRGEPPVTVPVALTRQP